MRVALFVVFVFAFVLSEFAYSSQCSNIFSPSTQVELGVVNKSQVQKFWLDFARKTNDQKLLQTISRIQYFLGKNKSILLSLTLEDIRSQDRLPTLLLILSNTSTGRKIISQNIHNFEKYYDAKNDDLRISIMVEARKLSGIGYFEEAVDSGEAPRLRLNKKLKIGTAAVVFGHELTHAYDFLTSKKFAKIEELAERQLFTEYNAYLNEKLIINELYRTSLEFREYFEVNKLDELNNLYTKDLSANDFAKNMKASDKIPESVTFEFLKKQRYPDF